MGGVSHLLRLVPEDEGSNATESLLELVSEDVEALAYLRCASRHVVLSDGEPLALRRKLVARGHHHTPAEVEAAIYEVALVLFPESWAAAHERLRLCVESRSKTTSLSSKRRSGERAAKTSPEEAIASLLLEDTASLREVASLSLYPLLGDELLRVTRRLWRALRERGRHFEPRHFSDHLYSVVRDIFPHSPGAEWSVEWADAVTRAALTHVASHTSRGASPDSSEAALNAVAEIEQAALAEDRRRYRLAVRAWVDAVLPPEPE